MPIFFATTASPLDAEGHEHNDKREGHAHNDKLWTEEGDLGRARALFQYGVAPMTLEDVNNLKRHWARIFAP